MSAVAYAFADEIEHTPRVLLRWRLGPTEMYMSGKDDLANSLCLAYEALASARTTDRVK